MECGSDGETPCSGASPAVLVLLDFRTFTRSIQGQSGFTFPSIPANYSYNARCAEESSLIWDIWGHQTDMQNKTGRFWANAGRAASPDDEFDFGADEVVRFDSANPDGLPSRGWLKLNKINLDFELFTPTDFLAAITQPIPDKGAQMVRYYGWYSNEMRGVRQRDPSPELVFRHRG
jgi:hypothetical protein